MAKKTAKPSARRPEQGTTTIPLSQFLNLIHDRLNLLAADVALIDRLFRNLKKRNPKLFED